ncbi:Spy/CpxP family protein refolding chaperone [Salidesulfovibrio onnuriiensis]|uniref:Spy/CpxP family protein refolding chaperone n=1 Tax=Salidesulfovibrio onnuriiensis TaxID=2583823 RepID=UPI0016504774|nr:Spy/CpxP family protein refolding chaperone [Salidesulfovibrio onnuriiensis]
MKKTSIIITSIILVSMAFTMALAMDNMDDHEKMPAPPHHEKMKKGPHPADQLVQDLERLGLTQAQKTKIAKQLKTEWDTMREMHDAVHEDMEAMRQAQFQGNVDAVRALSKKMAQQRQAHDVERAASMAKIRSVLTAEQSAKLDMIHRQFMEKMEKQRPPKKRMNMDSWILENI